VTKPAGTSPSPPPPAQPMGPRRSPKMRSVHTPRHHSCLTEIPSYTASGHFAPRPSQSTTWLALTRLALLHRSRLAERKTLLRGRNQDVAPQQLCKHRPSPQCCWLATGYDYDPLSLAPRHLSAHNLFCLDAGADSSSVAVCQPMKPAHLAASVSRFRHSGASLLLGLPVIASSPPPTRSASSPPAPPAGPARARGPLAHPPPPPRLVLGVDSCQLHSLPCIYPPAAKSFFANRRLGPPRRFVQPSALSRDPERLCMPQIWAAQPFHPTVRIFLARCRLCWLTAETA
jgi:hypothetical protein